MFQQTVERTEAQGCAEGRVHAQQPRGGEQRGGHAQARLQARGAALLVVGVPAASCARGTNRQGLGLGFGLG